LGRLAADQDAPLHSAVDPARAAAMNVTQHIAILPLWLSLLLVVVLPTAVTVSALVHFRKRLTLERLKTNAEVTSFTFATIGVVYAVLLGFAVLVVWEKYHDAGSAVLKEAGAAATLYRLAEGLGPGPGADLRNRLTSYLKSAIDEDWPAMSRGVSSENTTRALSDLYAAAVRAETLGGRDSAVLSETFDQLYVVTQARRDRNALAAGVVPTIIWMVLIVGGVMTIVSTFFFTSENLFAHVLMTGMLCVIVCLSILAIISISYPFTGPVSVTTAPLAELLGDFGS
jgi:hypothetical protein